MQAGVLTVPTPTAPVTQSAQSAPLQPTTPATTPATQSKCDPVGDGWFEHWHNPECLVGINEVCDEDNWVKCAKARNRGGLLIFGIILTIVLLIVFFSVGAMGKVIVLVAWIGFILLAKYGTNFWVEANARTEYRVVQKEIKIRQERYGMNPKEAFKSLQEEKLANNLASATRGSRFSAPAQTGLAAVLAAGATNAFISNWFKK